MTLGNKIRKYRQLRGLTQKELGLMAGFSEATADSRIRKYESDAMAPKTAIRQKLADAVDVDLSALSDLDISSQEDVMQALFQLEENFGMDIEKQGRRVYLSFRNDNGENHTLNMFMNLWSDQKKIFFPDPQNVTEEQRKDYELWKSRFVGHASRYIKDTDVEPGYASAVIEPLSAESEEDEILLAKFRAELDNLADLGLQIMQRYKSMT